ncbi:MAG TPA: J domain-containing protein [Acidimicrobiales bacterium]|nr:J domain-containing protein [Acidimicrobiales bacterium]
MEQAILRMLANGPILVIMSGFDARSLAGDVDGTNPTWYEVLGVSPGADHEQIRAEYLAKARLLHPDSAGSMASQVAERANREMALVNRAWEVLSDSNSRQTYDEYLASKRKPTKPAHKVARFAGKWVGRLYDEYRTGKQSGPPG